MSSFLNDQYDDDVADQLVWSGIIASVPVELSDLVDIVIPDLDPQLRWTGCKWKRRGIDERPALGDDCIAVKDQNNQFWIMDWWPSVDLTQYVNYTPILTATSSNPSLGTGNTATARYCKTGTKVHYYGKIVWGTGGNAGSGDYGISLPIEAAGVITPTQGPGVTVINSGLSICLVLYDIRSSSPLSSLNKFAILFPLTSYNGTANFLVAGSGIFAGSFGGNSGDEITWEITYECVD